MHVTVIIGPASCGEFNVFVFYVTYGYLVIVFVMYLTVESLRSIKFTTLIHKKIFYGIIPIFAIISLILHQVKGHISKQVCAK